MRGTLRWARADLRARRGQALITVAVVAGVVAALFLATMLLQGAVNPWQQLFARTRGADVLIYFHNGTNTSELRRVAGIKETGQPYQAAPATLERGKVKSPVEVRAPGGVQTVEWEREVFLTGPATLLCHGEFFI